MRLAGGKVARAFKIFCELGWIFVFATTQFRVILFGVGVLALGCRAFLLWSRSTKRWPLGFEEAVS